MRADDASAALLQDANGDGAARLAILLLMNMLGKKKVAKQSTKA